MQGVELITKLFVAPGDTVIVESPTYGFVLPTFLLYEAHVETVPMRADGLDLALLEKKLNKFKPKFIYLMPTFHNPTGVTTSQPHREKLLALCEKFAVPILEDGFEEDITYFGKVVQPIKSMDRHGLVFFLGTFSKTLMPGLRIGWIAAEKSCIEKLGLLKMYSDITSSGLSQLAIYEMGRQGLIDRHIARINRIYARRMRTALTSLRQNLPQVVEWHEPSGGYLIWLRIPCERRHGEMLRHELRQSLDSHKVSVLYGDFLFPDGAPGDLHIRVSISMLDEAEILEGSRRLGHAVTETLAKKLSPV